VAFRRRYETAVALISTPSALSFSLFLRVYHVSREAMGVAVQTAGLPQKRWQAGAANTPRESDRRENDISNQPLNHEWPVKALIHFALTN